MSSIRQFRACLGAFIWFLPGTAIAEVTEIRGSLTYRQAIETGSSNTQLAELVFEPEIRGNLGQGIQYTILGRARYDAADKLEPGKPSEQDAARSEWNRRLFWNDDADFELREAYADIYAGDWFFRIGKQQVVWGQSDGLRVLDQVNPLSYREFILGDYEDRRIPLWMLNIERPVGEMTAQFLWIPDTTYNEVPDRGRFAFSAMRFQPFLPADAASWSSRNADRPDNALKDSDVGARLSGFTSGWDWSVNALYAYLDSPAPERRTVAPGIYEIQPEYRRSTLLGGSASNAFDKYTLRAEIGFQTNDFVSVLDPDNQRGIADTPKLSGVLGLDYQFDADTFISGQVFFSHRTKYIGLAMTDQTETSFSALTTRELQNDQTKIELLLLQNFNDGDGVAQISVRHNLTDELTLRFGADVFYGAKNGVYGQYSDRDRLTIEVEYGF